MNEEMHEKMHEWSKKVSRYLLSMQYLESEMW